MYLFPRMIRERYRSTTNERRPIDVDRDIRQTHRCPKVGRFPWLEQAAIIAHAMRAAESTAAFP